MATKREVDIRENLQERDARILLQPVIDFLQSAMDNQEVRAGLVRSPDTRSADANRLPHDHPLLLRIRGMMRHIEAIARSKEVAGVSGCEILAASVQECREEIGKKGLTEGFGDDVMNYM